MNKTGSSFAMQIITKLEAFNKQLEDRLERKRKIADQMKEEQDFKKSMNYFKAFFISK